MAASLRPGTTALSVAQNLTFNQSNNSMKFHSSLNRIYMKRISHLCLRQKEGVSSLLPSGNFLIKNIKAIIPDNRCSIYKSHSLHNRLFCSSAFYHASQNNEHERQNSKDDLDKTRSQTDVAKPSFPPRTKNKETTATQPLTSDKLDSDVNTYIYNLNLNINRTGRVHLYQVMFIFYKMQETGECSSSAALLLLRCCGSLMTDEKLSTRADVSEKLWAYFQDMGVQMDASHYNTLLKNRVENNAPEFQAADFLAMMESKGVEPNRVTFQHIIAKFCSYGDMHGATTILEYMKEQNLSINENVFHSLIIGHCRDDDFNNAKGVMQVMVESDLDVASDTKMIYIMELARANKDFRKELDTIIGEGETFNDHDFFKLIVLFLEKGDKENASKVVEMLPKKRGYFQEMRNFIPAMLATGEVKLPFEIYSAFKVPSKSEGDNFESTEAHHGLFFWRSMIKHEYDSEVLLEYVEKLTGNPGTNMLSQVLECCVEHGNIDYGQSVYDAIMRKSGSTVAMNASSDFIRKYLSILRKQDTEECNRKEPDLALQFLVDMVAIGLRPLASELSREIIPAIMRGAESRPRQILKRYKDKIDTLSKPRSPLTLSSISNSMLRYLFHEGDKQHLGQAIDLIFNFNLPKRPHLWNISLAESCVKKS
jgi:hypothetical protein